MAKRSAAMQDVGRALPAENRATTVSEWSDYVSNAMFKTIPLILCFTCLSHWARAQDAPETKPERIQLDNGVTLLLAPLPEAKIVAVESFYPVGFCDEPAGMTQAAHLLEHLMCQGATKSYGPGESFTALRKLGMANAETLPTFTHYNYTAPPEELKTILKIEGERLTSLKITPELISEESDKCHEEAQLAYKNPESGMVKQAFMALFQFWNHGATEVRVRSGLDQIPADKLEAFYLSRYRPDALTLAVVGNFEKANLTAIAKEYLGSLPARKGKKLSVDWNSLADRAHITWDADVHAVCVYLPPPADPDDHALLSVWAMVMGVRLAERPDIREIADMVFFSNPDWPVGKLPLFLYATAKNKDKIPEIELAMKNRFREAIKEVAKDVSALCLPAALMGAPTETAIRETYERIASRIARNAASEEDVTVKIQIGLLARQMVAKEMIGASVSDGDLKEEKLRAVLEKTLDLTKLRVVTIGPPPETESQTKPLP